MWLKLPLFYDLFTVGLLTGGCLLLCLGHRVESQSRQSVVNAAGVNAAGHFTCRDEAVDSAAEPQREATKHDDAAEPQTQPELALLNTTLEVNSAMEGEYSPEQNKYARSVSAALTKSRHLSAG